PRLDGAYQSYPTPVPTPLSKLGGCYHCGQIGHYIWDCPYQDGTTSQSVFGPRRQEPAQTQPPLQQQFPEPQSLQSTQFFQLSHPHQTYQQAPAVAPQAAAGAAQGGYGGGYGGRDRGKGLAYAMTSPQFPTGPQEDPAIRGTRSFY